MSFPFSLELPNGEPADPPEVRVSYPKWRVGDPVVISPRKPFRVVALRVAEEGEDVLIVEQVDGRADRE